MTVEIDYKDGSFEINSSPTLILKVNEVNSELYLTNCDQYGINIKRDLDTILRVIVDGELL